MTRRTRTNGLSDADLAFLDGLLDAFEDLPDGAWQAACEDAIRTCGRFNHRMPYNVWLAWCIARSKEQQAQRA